MIRTFIGKMIVALVKAMMRAFVGMLMGIAFMAFILVMLLFFATGASQSGQEITLVEIIGLVIVGAGIGAIAGFFDMLDFQRRAVERARGRHFRDGK